MNRIDVRGGYGEIFKEDKNECEEMITELSVDKNMVPLKVAISGFFCFIGTSSCPDCRLDKHLITFNCSSLLS
ncbi:hypothetical protein ABES58_11900 [Paenibacillus lautus]|uniref:hypothetical protein n=1 Tax=Paenibacillus lautus TaxID=1401 RepID=UPI003D297242